jgi:hypothetical protein
MAGTVAGSLIFDTRTDTSGFERGTRDINGQTEQLTNSFSGLGKIIVATFSVVAIKEFGTQLIETTANLQALDAQFEQVFKGEEGAQAMELINEQAEELGIHVDRLKESFNKFGAQVKGSGMEAKQSLEATEIATINAADAAAFYDVSLETASASVASFMKGNFEAGDAIGVYTSAAQMSVRSNEMYGKSWDKLTESERQWLLLDTITKSNEMSGAAGQSTREQDSWAISTGNLQAAWARFLESIGTGVLDSAVSLVQGMTNAITQLTDFMQNNTSTIDNFKIAIGSLAAALATYFIIASRWTILENLIGVTVRLELAMRTFGAALMSPVGQLGMLVGVMVLFISLALKMNDAWGDMSGMEKAVSVLGLVAIAAAACAIAVGAVQSAATMGIAAVAIVGGTLAIGAAISRAQKQAEAGISASSSGIRMPHLATGAVIPANGEFMAVLGDQKHGRNLEAPEGLIRQIMREEIGTKGGGSGNATVILQIDGKELARATAPYNSGENMRQGTRLINGVT